MKIRIRRAPRKIQPGRAFRYRPNHHDGLDVILAYGNRDFGALDDGVLVGRIGKNVIVCADGYRFFVIAGRGSLSWPRPMFSAREEPTLSSERPWNYRGPYVSLECNFPELSFSVTLPVKVIRDVIAIHGGIHHLEGPGLRSMPGRLWVRFPILRGTLRITPGCPVPVLREMPPIRRRPGVDRPGRLAPAPAIRRIGLTNGEGRSRRPTQWPFGSAPAQRKPPPTTV